MGALLGVAQGSERPPRVVVMRWRGGTRQGQAGRLRRQGRGVRHRRHLDQAGRRHGGHEGRHGRRAPRSAGLMRTLALRKAKVNAIGIVGLVENMPDGKAQRPGDVVTSMSGQTIEVINTDAEGRLVLADLLTYVQKNEQPAAMIDLATLTGAIIVALGNHHAGLFSNNDELAEELTEGRAGDRREGLAHAARAGIRQADRFQDRRHEEHRRTQCRLDHRRRSSCSASWRTTRPGRISTWPGPRWARRRNETNQSWGSGWGVRLLDEFVRARFERGKDAALYGEDGSTAMAGGALLPSRATAARKRAAGAPAAQPRSRLARRREGRLGGAAGGAERASLVLRRRVVPAARRGRRRPCRRRSRSG